MDGTVTTVTGCSRGYTLTRRSYGAGPREQEILTGIRNISHPGSLTLGSIRKKRCSRSPSCRAFDFSNIEFLHLEKRVGHPVDSHLIVAA